MGDKTWVFRLGREEDGFRVEMDGGRSDEGYEFSRAILSTFFGLIPYSQTLARESLEGFRKSLEGVEIFDFTFMGDRSLYSFEEEEEKEEEQDKDKPLAKTGMGSSATFICRLYRFQI